MPDEWFPGEASNADHASFLPRLRDRARRDGLMDVPPGRTGVLISSAQSSLVVGVRAPGLPTTGPKPVLQAGYSDDDGTRYLEGAWELRWRGRRRRIG